MKLRLPKLGLRKNTGILVACLFACTFLIAALSPAVGFPAAWAAQPEPFLTWSDDPQTSQTITWLMPADCPEAKVQYLKESDFADSFARANEAADTVGRAFGSSGTDKLFSVNLTGLTVGTTYFYRVGAEDNWSKAYNFTTAPTDTDRFSFLYLGDAQMNEELDWSDSYSEWEKLLAAAAADSPDLRFSLQVGDVTNEEDAAEVEYRHFISAASGLFSRIPFMSAKGNHDGDFFANVFKLPESGLEHFYSFDYGNAHFAVLDTGQNALDMATIWLRQDLQNNNSKWKFVVFHHPVYYAFDDGKTSICDSIRERWAPVFEEYKVDLAFVGHQHMYMRTKPMRERTNPEAGQDLVYIMGVSGNKFYGANADYGYIDKVATKVSNYQIINIDGDTLTLRSVGADGQVLDTYQVKKNAAIWPADVELSVNLQGDKATLSWPAPNGYFTRYWVYQDGELIDTVDSDMRSYTVAGLNESRNYTFKIEAGSAASPLAEESLSRTLYLVLGGSDSGESLTIEDTDFYIPIQTATDGSGYVISEPLQQITMQSASTLVSVVIPAGARVSGPAAWNGLMTTPAAANPSIKNVGTVNAAVEVGFSAGTLTFDKAVKLVFPGQAGKSAGYFDSGGTWHAISTVVSGTDAATVTTELAGKGAQEGYQNAGSDLVIWTMHFTMFVAYTPTNTGGSSGGSGGSAGTEQAVTSSTGKATIKPGAGGSVSLGGEASIEVPANALSGVSSLEVRVEKVSSPPTAPDGLRFLSDVYEFSVDGKNSYNFSKYVTITLSFDAVALSAGQTPAVYYYDEGLGNWVALGGSVSGTNASVQVNHFTKFAVLAAAAEETGGTEGSTGNTAQAEKAEGLNDIAGHWAQANIGKLVQQGSISGYPDGTFRPDDTITRAEFAAILVKAFNLSGQEGRVFADTADHWAKDYIAAAAANGIVSGYDDDTFGPDDLITREQMAVMIVKAAKLTSTVDQEASFSDSGVISAWAADSVAAVVQHSFMSGYPDGSFQPQGQATRAEAATVVVNALR